jgi:hypothetical protein
VINTLLSGCAEAETEAMRRKEIRRNRNAEIIGGINGLQVGGSELVSQEREKTGTNQPCKLAPH